MREAWPDSADWVGDDGLTASRLDAVDAVVTTATVAVANTGTIVLSHAFWGMDGAARAMNQTQALKNLAIMGGLLMLAVVGPGRYSVDRG